MTVHVTGSELHVCFDYYGQDKEVLQLIHDGNTGVVVNGKIFAKPGSDTSFFQSLEVISSGCSIVAGCEAIHVNRSVDVVWDVTHDWRECSDTSRYLVIDENHVIVQPAEGVEFILMRSNRTNKRGETWLFTNFFMVEHKGLSKQTSGLLGQFLQMVVEVSINSEDNKAALIRFPKEPERPSVHAIRTHRWSFLKHKRFSCWYVENQGQGLIVDNDGQGHITGNPADLIVEHTTE